MAFENTQIGIRIEKKFTTESFAKGYHQNRICSLNMRCIIHRNGLGVPVFWDDVKITEKIHHPGNKLHDTYT
jgi:hypothetical protein